MSDASIFGELFTSGRLLEIAWHGRSDTLSVAVRALARRGMISAGATISDVIDAAFRVLLREYPVEYVYKSCVLRRTVFGRYSPSTTALYMEFPIAEARADLLLINGDATVFEIKTRFDDPSRLGGQLEEYFRAFTRVTVVVDPAQVRAYADVLPADVGLSVMTNRFSISSRRTPVDRYSGLELESIFRLLRQDEHGGFAGDLSAVDPVRRSEVALQRFQRFSPQEATSYLVQTLKARQRTQGIAKLCAQLPESLHAGVFSFRWRQRDWRDLQTVLASPAPL